MNLPRQFVVLALALALTTSGCSWFKRKKPQTVAPQAQAPTVQEPPPPVATNTPPAEPEPMPEKPASQATAPKPKPRPKTTHAKKPAPVATKPSEPAAKTTEPPKTVAQASAPPPRVVIQEGGAQPANNQISTAMPHDQASDRQRTTQQLLDATDANLRSLNRALSADERSMVEQIRSYMQQSRDAVKDGDLIRAHNLALKAHLLSDELAKR